MKSFVIFFVLCLGFSAFSFAGDLTNLEKYKKYNLQPFLRDREKDDMFELLSCLEVGEPSAGIQLQIKLVKQLLRESDVSAKEIKEKTLSKNFFDLEKVEKKLWKDK